MKERLLLIVCVFISYSTVAQNSYLDSLNNRLTQGNTTVSDKFCTYKLLVAQLLTEMMYEKASAVNSDYLKLAIKEKAYTEITKAYAHEGTNLLGQGLYDEAKPYIDSVNNSASRTDDKMASAYASCFLLRFSVALRDFEKAINYGLQAQALLDQTPGDPLLAFKINYNMYRIYTEWNDLKNSKKYTQRAIDVALKSDNKNDLSNAYSAMAVVYTYAYDTSKAEADFQEILDYSEKAALLYHQFPGRVGGHTYAIARNNKASYLLEYSSNITPAVREEIEVNLQESLSISSRLPHAQSIQAASYGMLSNLAKQDGDWLRAEDYMLRAYAIMRTQNPIYYHIMTRVVNELADIYERKGDLKKALEFKKKYDEYRALLFNQSEAEAVKKIEAQYQFEKHEQEIQLLKERASNEQQQKLLYVGLGIIGLIGSFYMFRSYHYRLRYSLEREKQLETEKNEAELQIKFEQEEQSRLKAEQQLLAMQQQQLQDEVMANQLHIQHKNNVLQQLKEKYEEDKPLNIREIIRDENLLDNDFEKAKFQIQEMHPNFFKSLRTESKQKLSLLDLKYCAYFYLGMETKQIAKILNVEPKSVRMTKYRLKQKLGLDAEMDLVEYLKHLQVS